MRLDYAGCSRTGLVRQNNEDALLMCSAEAGALFIVADGIGGREHGETVSTLIRDSYNQWWEELFLPNCGNMEFQTAVQEIKDRIVCLNREVVGQYGMGAAGSTIALLFLFQGGSLCLSAGDSRIYLARRMDFRQLTVDDIFDNLGEEEKKLWGDSETGKLVSAIGICSEPELTLRTNTVKFGDRFFLCSDGVYRFISPEKLRRAIGCGFSAPETVVDKIAQEVERNGAQDNYSMAYLRVKSV